MDIITVEPISFHHRILSIKYSQNGIGIAFGVGILLSVFELRQAHFKQPILGESVVKT
jgi:hypothetical protein